MDTTKDGVFTTKCAHARARASFQTKRTVGEHGLVAEQTTAGAGHDRAGDLDRAELARVRAVGEQGDAVLPGVWSRKKGGVGCAFQNQKNISQGIPQQSVASALQCVRSDSIPWCPCTQQGRP